MFSKQQFIFVKYNGVSYPQDYFSEIHEVAGHFDKSKIESYDKYSLHTEYSYGKRKLDTDLIYRFPVLRRSHREGVPQLWYSAEWASEFADFIIALTCDKNPPAVIEIHPPFNDYCSINEFAERFCIFEKRIHAVYRDTLIAIENRAGAAYRGGKFLISKAIEIAGLCKTIKLKKLNLGVMLDFPQLLTAECIDPIKFKAEKYLSAADVLSKHQDLIMGIHIWGKKKVPPGDGLLIAEI